MVIKPQLHLQWGHILKLVSCFFNHYKTRPDWWRVPNEDVFCTGRNLTALTINMSLLSSCKAFTVRTRRTYCFKFKIYIFVYFFFFFFINFFLSRCELLSIINRGTQIRSDAIKSTQYRSFAKPCRRLPCEFIQGRNSTFTKA